MFLKRLANEAELEAAEGKENTVRPEHIQAVKKVSGTLA